MYRVNLVLCCCRKIITDGLVHQKVSCFVSLQLLEWHVQLDGGLPDPLGSVGVWLHQAEKVLQEELVLQQSHEETANVIHRTRQLHQVMMRNHSRKEREMRCPRRRTKEWLWWMCAALFSAGGPWPRWNAPADLPAFPWGLERRWRCWHSCTCWTAPGHGREVWERETHQH